jgi:hypothetical protein
MNVPIAKSRRETRDLPYQPDAIIQRLRELLRKYNESYREASLRAGLDHQAIRRILDGQRPNMTACILLGNHFGVNPNEFLQLAGWPALELFDIRTVNSENLPVEAVEVALALAKISDPGARKKKAEAVLTLINV